MDEVIRGTSLQCGRLAFVSELAGAAGSSVRIVARVVSLDYVHNRMTVTHRNASIVVDTSLVDLLE